MKTHILLAVITLFSTFQLRASESAVETAFIQKVQSAIDAKDGDAMFSLVYLDGVEQSMKEMLQKQISGIVSKPVESISLVDPASDQIFEYTREGIVYRTNLTPVKMLKIEYTNTTPASPGSVSNTSMSLPVGDLNGTLFITTAAPVKK